MPPRDKPSWTGFTAPSLNWPYSLSFGTLINLHSGAGKEYNKETYWPHSSWPRSLPLYWRMFQICTEEFAIINIRTVLRKTNILISQHDLQHFPPELDAQIQVHTDGIPLLGTAIGDGNFIRTFLDDKLLKTSNTLT